MSSYSIFKISILIVISRVIQERHFSFFQGGGQQPLMGAVAPSPQIVFLE